MIGRIDSWLNSGNVGVGVPEWAMWSLLVLFAATAGVLVWVAVDYFRQPPTHQTIGRVDPQEEQDLPLLHQHRLDQDRQGRL